MNMDMKFLVISDATKFALTDVYQGYLHAFKALKIPYETFPYHHFREIVGDTTSFHIMHSTALIRSKGITHVMFIGGLNIPNFIYESLYHLKSVVVSTEDPHSFDPMKKRIDLIDYYFSNERSIGLSKRFPNSYYCPTGASQQECGKFPLEVLEDKYKSDILFLGAVYPNRRKLMESILPFVEKHHLNFKVCGHVSYMPKTSPLWKYVYDARTIPHMETVRYYNGAKVVLNMLRDTHWNPRTKSKKNPHNRGRFSAESLNPRAYEVPMCQGFMLLEDTRAEAREVFTENEVGFFSDEKSLTERLRYFLKGPGAKRREDMAYEAYKKVAQEHSYVNRLQYVLSVIRQHESA